MRGIMETAAGIKVSAKSEVHEKFKVTAHTNNKIMAVHPASTGCRDTTGALGDKMQGEPGGVPDKLLNINLA